MLCCPDEPLPCRGGPQEKLTVAAASPAWLPPAIAATQPVLKSGSISTEPGMNASPAVPAAGATSWPLMLPVAVSLDGWLRVGRGRGGRSHGALQGKLMGRAWAWSGAAPEGRVPRAPAHTQAGLTPT